jgi:hypothetical protein
VRDAIKRLVGRQEPPPATVIVESGAVVDLDITSGSG